MTANKYRDWRQQLDGLDCPQGHLAGLQIDGFLFSIHTLPAELDEQPWLTGIFNGQSPHILPTAISAGLWQLNADTRQAVLAESYQLPAACHQSPHTLLQWQQGFCHGLQYGEALWPPLLESITGLGLSLQLFWQILRGDSNATDTVDIKDVISDYQLICNTLRGIQADAASGHAPDMR